MTEMKVKRSGLTEGGKLVPVIAFTRTCGYYAPIMNANKGKACEISERKLVNVNNLNLS